jgi:hypothetical protein
MGCKSIGNVYCFADIGYGFTIFFAEQYVYAGFIDAKVNPMVITISVFVLLVFNKCLKVWDRYFIRNSPNVAKSAKYHSMFEMGHPHVNTSFGHCNLRG